MGNRAVIVHNDNKYKSSAKCIYLHWNGGRASVEAFLKAGKHLSINANTDAGMLELANMIAKSFFGCEVNKLNVYVEFFENADKDNYDNGLYIIDDTMSIIGRKYQRHGEEYNPDKTKEIFEHITSRYPVWNS